MKPRFTVIIPTYRRNESLARCLNRLMPDRQRIPADQFVVVVTDDGPPADNARLLVENTYPWAHWVAGPGRGPAANRNCGAAQAQTDWLVFTDDDCLPKPSWLSAFAERLDSGLDGCRVLEGRTGHGGNPEHGPFHAVPGNDQGGFLWSCNFAITRELFDQLGGFDERFPFPHLEDVDLRLRLDDAGERYIFVPEALVDHPPRPIGSAWKWARAQESSFYLARKRGVSLAAINFSPGVYLRGCARCFRRARNFREAVRLAGRIVEEVALLLLLLPGWILRYPRNKTSSPIAPTAISPAPVSPTAPPRSS